MLARSIISKMPAAEKSLVRQGAIGTGIITGMVGYWNYREAVRKDFLRSEAHYRFS
jgi:hypothetical protein